MGTKQMRVSEDLYARVVSENRDDETLAETLDRLVGGYDLADFADDIAAYRAENDVEEAVDFDGAADNATPP